MKCIHCGSDTKYPDRQKNGGRCQACKHPFAFEPKTDPLSISDGLFERVLKDVSGDGTVFFTQRQVWYEFNRRLWRKSFWRGRWGTVAGISAVCGIVSAMTLGVLGPLAVPGMALGASGVAFGAIMNRRLRKNYPMYVKVDFPEFRNKYLHLWLRAHGPLDKLLPPPEPQTPVGPPPAPELLAYSFDRALVTERAEEAALLVANNFHFENNCAILSRDGYPFDRAETVMTMLRGNPQLTVFAVHDASVAGGMLAHALRGESWFPDPGVRLVDLGLRPRHAQQMGLILRREARTTCPPALHATLAPEEIRWLEEGSVAELAVLRPARLLRAIYQGFARANQPGGYVDTGGGIWIYDGGASDAHAADSFG